MALSATARRVQAQYEEALEELVGHLRRRTESGVPVVTRLAGRFRLTEGQAAVLDRAGAALATCRNGSARWSPYAARPASGFRSQICWPAPSTGYGRPTATSG